MGPARRWKARLKANRTTALAYRSGVGVIGGGVVVVGLILIPLPGPGWLIVFLGLSVLASEFAWAERLLGRARARVQSWTTWVSRRSRSSQLLIGASGLVLLAAVLAVVLATTDGFPSIPRVVFS